MCTCLTISYLLTCFNSLTLIWAALEGILIGPGFFFLIKLMGEWKAPKVQNRNTQWHKHDLPGVVWWEWDGRMRFWVWSLWSLKQNLRWVFCFEGEVSRGGLLGTGCRSSVLSMTLATCSDSPTSVWNVGMGGGWCQESCGVWAFIW